MPRVVRSGTWVSESRSTGAPKVEMTASCPGTARWRSSAEVTSPEKGVTPGRSSSSAAERPKAVTMCPAAGAVAVT